jgi:hypothetical protein
MHACANVSVEALHAKHAIWRGDRATMMHPCIYALPLAWWSMLTAVPAGTSSSRMVAPLETNSLATS